MMRLAAAGLALVLAGLPLMIDASTPVATAALAAAALSLAGVGFRATPVVVAGASLAWIAYAVALAHSGATLDVTGGTAIGIVTFLLLETVDFAGRFRSISLPQRAILSQVGWWLLFCAVVAGLAIAATAAALVVARPIPPPVAVTVALAAAAIVTVGLTRLLR